MEAIRTEYAERVAQLRRLTEGYVLWRVCMCAVLFLTAHLTNQHDNSLTPQETRDIIAAMRYGEYHGYGYQQHRGRGHVYTCPNGHPYFIGDCGRAMQESQCPDCGATIGGREHRLQADNRQALEFWRQAYGRG